MFNLIYNKWFKDNLYFSRLFWSYKYSNLPTSFRRSSFFARLISKIENNSTWGSAFYVSEWVKVISSWVILLFSLYVCCCWCIRIFFVRPNQQILNAFYAILTFHFKYQIFYTCKLDRLSWWKSTHVRKGAFSLVNEKLKLIQDHLFLIFKAKHFFTSIVRYNSRPPISIKKQANVKKNNFCLSLL